MDKDTYNCKKIKDLTKRQVNDYVIDKFMTAMNRHPSPHEIWIIENSVHHTLELLQKEKVLTMETERRKKPKKQKAEVFK